MERCRLSLHALADRTKELDPAGRGVSFQLIGFLVKEGGKSTRETTSARSAALIAMALDCQEDVLFTRGSSLIPECSTQNKDEIVSV